MGKLNVALAIGYDEEAKLSIYNFHHFSVISSFPNYRHHYSLSTSVVTVALLSMTDKDDLCLLFLCDPH